MSDKKKDRLERSSRKNHDAIPTFKLFAGYIDYIVSSNDGDTSGIFSLLRKEKFF